MKVQELMIGDWVQVQDVNTQEIYFCQITKLDPPFIYFNSELDCVGLSYDCIFPIPITPEILEKNGFIRFGTDYILEGRHFGLENPSTPSNYLDNYWLRVSIKAVRIKFVHELQHALRLCGIEKEINLRPGATEIV